MNYKIFLCLISTFLLLHSACTHEIPSPQLYTYNHSTTTLKWTAYKYTTKVGVSGSFNEITVNDCITADTPAKVIQNMNFRIDTETLDSESTFRDNNILTYFFDYLELGETISGNVHHCEGDKSSGRITIDLMLNGVAREIPFDYRMQGTMMHLIGNFSLSDFNADFALDSMQNCCDELHTGPDGVHLLWPDIEIEIKTDLDDRIN